MTRGTLQNAATAETRRRDENRGQWQELERLVREVEQETVERQTTNVERRARPQPRQFGYD